MAPQAWWQGTTQFKRISAITGALIGILTALTMMANAMKVAEPHWVATRGFVRENISDIKDRIAAEIKSGDITQNMQLTSLHHRLIESELSRARDKRFEIGERIANYQFMLNQNAAAPPDLRDAISRQVSTLMDERVSTSQRIDALERELSGRRP